MVFLYVVPLRKIVVEIRRSFSSFFAFRRGVTSPPPPQTRIVGLCSGNFFSDNYRNNVFLRDVSRHIFIVFSFQL